MSHDAIAAELAALTATIAAGQAAETRRAARIRTLYRNDPGHWTQSRLAETAGISQAAVSKLISKPGSQALDSTSPADLIGRTIGIGGWIVFRTRGEAQCTPVVDKLVEGTMPPTTAALAQLRALIDKDLPHLAGGERRLIREALAEVDRLSDGPVGAVRLSQHGQMRQMLSMEVQKQALTSATARA